MIHFCALELKDLLVPIAIILSANLGILGAWLAIRSQKKIARKQAALDLILKLDKLTKDEKEEQRIFYVTMKNGSAKWNSILEPYYTDFLSLKRKENIHNYLNRIETICIALIGKVVDEEAIRKTWEGDVIEAWDKGKQFVKTLRAVKGDGEYYENVEKVATKWKKRLKLQRKKEEKGIKGMWSGMRVRFGWY